MFHITFTFEYYCNETIGISSYLLKYILKEKCISFSFSKLIHFSFQHLVGPCNSWDSTLSTNSIQNWAHSKSDNISSRCIVATGWRWTIFEIIANRAANVAFECTEYINHMIGYQRWQHWNVNRHHYFIHETISSWFHHFQNKQTIKSPYGLHLVFVKK